MSVFELLKKWLKIEDLWAVVVVILVTIVFSVGAIFLAGYFTSGIVFDAELLSTLIFTVFTMSQIGYQAFKEVEKRIDPLKQEPAG